MRIFLSRFCIHSPLRRVRVIDQKCTDAVAYLHEFRYVWQRSARERDAEVVRAAGVSKRHVFLMTRTARLQHEMRAQLQYASQHLITRRAMEVARCCIDSE